MAILHSPFPTSDPLLTGKEHLETGVQFRSMEISMVITVDNSKTDFSPLHSLDHIKTPLVASLSGFPALERNVSLALTLVSLGEELYTLGSKHPSITEYELNWRGVDYAPEPLKKIGYNDILTDIEDLIPATMPNREYIVQVAQEAALKGAKLMAKSLGVPDAV